MKRFRIKIKGTTPLLQHRMRDEELFALLGTKTKMKKDKEERLPRDIAEDYAYKRGDKFVIPTSYIVGAFKSIASEYKQKNSTKRSVKSIASGIFRPEEEFVTLTCHNGKPLKDFEVDIRKATNHQKGAVAVCRPRFDEWSTEMTATINEELISPDVVLQMLNDGGIRSGIGSFRVSKGGYFGQFSITEFTELK